MKQMIFLQNCSEKFHLCQNMFFSNTIALEVRMRVRIEKPSSVLQKCKMSYGTMEQGYSQFLIVNKIFLG